MGGEPDTVIALGDVHHGSADHYDLTDTETMVEVLRALRRTRPAGVVHDLAGQAHEGQLLDVEGEVLSLFFSSRPLQGPASFRFALHGVVFVLLGVLLREDRRMTLRGPLRLYSLDRRMVTRWPLAPGRAELRWHEPDAGEDRVRISEVRDLTPDGVGITPPPDAAPLPGGVFAALLRVGETSVPCLARTRRVSTRGDEPCGVSLRVGPLGDTMIETYLRERLPQLSPRRAHPLQTVRALMDDSGYLALRGGGPALQRWHELVTTDTLSYDRVYTAADGTVLGHVSVTRIYDRTWVFHQLACLGGHAESGEARIALYMLCGTAPVLHDGAEARALAYFDQDNRWHQLFFRRFVDWIGDSRVATIHAFDRFERQAPAEPWAPPSGCRIETLRDDGVVEACAIVRAHLPEVVADAMDVHPGQLRRPPVDHDGRGREVFVLWEGDQRVAVALCETGHRALSLFNVNHMAQIFVHPGIEGPSEGAHRALISACRAYYEARGVTQPMLVSPAGTLAGGAEPGTVWAERMGCFVVAGQGLRQWENFCCFHFGQRWRRHQAQKG